MSDDKRIKHGLKRGEIEWALKVERFLQLVCIKYDIPRNEQSRYIPHTHEDLYAAFAKVIDLIERIN